MQDTQKNKEKLLDLLQQRQDTVEISSSAKIAQSAPVPVVDKNIEKKIPEKQTTVQKFVNSPTSFKSLNLVFWSTFLFIDAVIGFIIYVYWF